MSDEIDGLPQLTDKQQKFVEYIAEGKSKTDAYRLAYDASGMQAPTQWAAASKLAADSKVSIWLEYIKREAVNKLVDETSYDLKAHIDELNEMIEFAKQNKATGPALQGVISKGKACNHYTEHKTININNKSDLSLLERIGKEFGESAAHEAAKNMGYDPKELRKLDS